MESTVQERPSGTLRERPPGTEWVNEGLMHRPFPDLKVGERFISRGRTITEADVVSFAALTGDFHPQHTDKVFAERSIFGARVAHGMLIASYSMGMVPTSYVVALRRLRNLVFKRPVYLGDTIHVEATIADLRPFTEEAGLVTGRWKIVNQDAKTVFKLEIEALWRQDWL